MASHARRLLPSPPIPSPARPSRLDLLIPLGLLALCGWRLWPFLQGRVPVVGDHAVHIHKLWFLWERLLPAGRLKGWSSYWFLGEPVGDLYPPGQDLWTAALRAATLGQLSYERSYGLAITGFYALSGLALYEVGRRFGGRLAGALAACLWILDQGAWEQGGWTYQVWWGVWGQSLGQALLLVALPRLLDWLDQGAPRELGLAGLLLGLALLCHPMGLMLLAVGAVALVLAGQARDRRRLGRVAAAGGLGLLVSAGFLLPFLARSSYERNVGRPGMELSVWLGELIHGQILTHMSPGATLLALLGVGLALARRDGPGRLLAALLAATLALHCYAPLDWPHLGEIWPGLTHPIWGRFAIPAKALAYLLAGSAATAALGWARGWRGAPLRGLVGAALLVALSLGLARDAAQASSDRDSLPMQDQSPTWPATQRWLDWSKTAWAARSDFYRVALLLSPHDHRLMASTLVNHTPLLKMGYTPAHSFSLSPDRPSRGLFRAASVRWLLSDHVVQDEQAKLVEDWGAYKLYEFTGYRPERYTLEGPGYVEQLTFEDERAAFRLRGTSPDSRLLLHVADFPRWRALMNGQEVLITAAPLWEGGYDLGMSVPVRDGILVFDYVRRPVDIMATALSVAGVGLCLALIRRPARKAGSGLVS